MYVCVCNAIKATEIHEALDQGCTSVEAVAAELGLGTGCGTCVEFARTLIENELDGLPQGQPYAAA